jgi:DNA-binding response OmpR family regulator
MMTDTDTSLLILIVEDHPKNIQFLGNLLMPHGYEIGVARNGQDAMAFLKERMPDLILLDVMMPEMDGYQFCRQIKKNLEFSHIPVIFLTAKSESDDIVKGFEAGGTDYVTKPFISAELMARIRTQLEINQLRHLIPICSFCRRVRDDQGLWDKLENYLDTHTKTRFSHGVCKECAKKHYPGLDIN